MCWTAIWFIFLFNNNNNNNNNIFALRFVVSTAKFQQTWRSFRLIFGRIVTEKQVPVHTEKLTQSVGSDFCYNYELSDDKP
jgi:hypothetical protein